MLELQFEVVLDEEGNYCAHAPVENGELFTDARDLDGLLVMVKDVIALYEEEAGVTVAAFSFHFGSQKGIAA